MKKTVLICIFLAFAFGCRYPELDLESPQVNDVKASEKFRITLPEEHESGQLWQLEDNYDHRLVEKLNTTWHGREKGVDFNFQAQASGTATLTLLKRKFTDTSEVKHFIVRITGN